jgi:hypothetical protein
MADATSKLATQHCQWGFLQPMANFSQWLMQPANLQHNIVNGAFCSPWLTSANG